MNKVFLILCRGGLLIPACSWAAWASPFKWDPASEAAGLSLSLGRKARVTARLTYDRGKAAGGGMVFVVESATPRDAEAIRMSEALVTGDGGLMSYAGIKSRLHGVAALRLDRSRWEKARLALDLPVFGEARSHARGFPYRLVEKTARRFLEEGEVVTVDSVLGVLKVYPPSEAEFELELAQAISAYEGLTDGQALVQWFEGRAEATSSTATASAWLGTRLIEELSLRLAAGSARARDFAKVRKAVEKSLPEASRDALRRREEGLLKASAKVGRSSLEGIARALREAGTAAAVERLRSEAKALDQRLKDLAQSLGLAAALESFSRDYSRVLELAQARLKALAGRPGATLSEILSASGASAPERRVLDATLYRRFLAEYGLEPLIAEMSSDASLDLRRKAERIRGLFEAARLAADSALGREIQEWLPREGFFQVWAKDGEEAAGEPLRFVPAEELLPALPKAWAGLWRAELLGRRKREGRTLQPQGGVVIERMVAANVSGTVFTRDPVSLRRERMLVSAVFGDCEGLAEGLAADQYLIERGSGREVFPALVADKRERLEFAGGGKGLQKAVVPPGLSLRRCLSPDQLQRLSRAARALENHFGYGLEIVFAFEAERLLILDSRPIAGTAAKAAAADPFEISAPAAEVPAVLPVR